MQDRLLTALRWLAMPLRAERLLTVRLLAIPLRAVPLRAALLRFMPLLAATLLALSLWTGAAQASDSTRCADPDAAPSEAVRA
ncbi:MAG: hypothetical protein AAFR46_16945, partial [Pseudomonadota bacterium]